MLRPPAIIVGDLSGTSWPAFHEKLCLVSVLKLADHLPPAACDSVHRFFRLHRSYGQDGRLSEEAERHESGDNHGHSLHQVTGRWEWGHTMQRGCAGRKACWKFATFAQLVSQLVDIQST